MMIATGDAGVAHGDAGVDAGADTGAGDGSVVHQDGSTGPHAIRMSGGCSASPGGGSRGNVRARLAALGLVVSRRRR